MKLKDKWWEIALGGFLILLTAALYAAHYLIFNDMHHIMIYFLGDLAFLPIEVLLVVIIIHRIIAKREQKIKLDKLGVVINTFFSETGTQLLEKFSAFDNNLGSLKESFTRVSGFKSSDVFNLIKNIKKQDYSVDSEQADLEGLKMFLRARRDFLLMLLENPMLLEHDRFTDLLWAALHLQEELSHRKSLRGLSRKDYDHLSNDIKRVYALLLEEYIIYLMNLKNKYPYLFSLASRINPFNPQSKAEIA